MKEKIDLIHAHEILDSRGNPTLNVTVLLKNGTRGSASVPSGASTGIHEALELRDGDKKRYNGKGVSKAVKNVNTKIAKLLFGMDVMDLQKIDNAMRIFDGTANKHRLGANAILGVSMACAHAGARRRKVPLYQHLREVYEFDFAKYKLPTPLMNIFNGGSHASTNLDMQEFIIIPHGFKKFGRKLQAGVEIYHALGEILQKDGLDTDLGDEGGYAPDVGKTEDALEYLKKAVRKAKYKLAKEISFGIDVAASEFFDPKKNKYILKTDRRKLSGSQMTDLFADWIKKYPLMSIEDGLDQDAWDDWKEHTARLGKDAMLIGDDLFVTNPERIQKGINLKIANAVLIKMNQIGTMTETMDAIKLAQKHRYKIVISHRSGETADSTIADLAVAVNAQYIKTGAPSRSERLVKYNRLLEIEEELMVK
ncbi:phosphopyruvate hydratase [Candidatus Uhrbacteria bacterium]|nr:phosphopyruvate hydratase [Candidatus Uhrbacteria bacterium]MBT7717249.1 phosphopyruvate hydratase [Candidatus Uhrbacteria bacterium]